MPELRIDPLTVLRLIVAGERGSRPGRSSTWRLAPESTPESDPFAAGMRTGRRPRSIAAEKRRLAVRFVRTSTPALSGGRGRGRGSARLRARRSRPFSRAPATVRTRGREFNAPIRDLARRARSRSVATAMFLWRERMVPHDARRTSNVIVNGARRRGSLPHTHAQLVRRCRFLPARCGARASASRVLGSHEGPQSLLRPSFQEEVAAPRAHRRDEEGPWHSRVCRALPFHLSLSHGPPSRVSPTTAARAGVCSIRC